MFARPHRIIVAQTVPDVLPALRMVQETVSGGAYAAGYVGYEAAPAFDDALRVWEGKPEAFASGLPLLWFGLYDGLKPFR